MPVHSLQTLANQIDFCYNSQTGFFVLLVNYQIATPTFTAATPSTFTVAGGHNFVNGNRIRVSSAGTLPAGLNTNTTYFVINRTATTFQLSLTRGGTAVAITDVGTGAHTATEQVPDQTDDLTIWARYESQYFGSARQPYAPGAAVQDAANNRAATPPVTVTFTPTTGNITYNYLVLIRGGTAVYQATTGTIDQFEPPTGAGAGQLPTTQTIAQGATRGFTLRQIKVDI